MPGGRVHTLLTASQLATAVIARQPVEYCAGLAAGILLSPDLDVDNGNISDALLRRVARPLQWAWRILWTPYAMLIPHRHWLSHAPILSTLVRLGYLWLAANAAVFGMDRLGVDIALSVAWDWRFFWGLAQADAVHALADAWARD